LIQLAEEGRPFHDDAVRQECGGDKKTLEWNLGNEGRAVQAEGVERVTLLPPHDNVIAATRGR